MGNMRYRIFFILGFIFMSGCASSVRVPVQKPAQINLVGVDKIVIGEIGGNLGRSFSDLLTTRLFESQKYEVLDRDNLDRVMQEHQLNASGAVDQDTAVSLGKLVGASALIAGNVGSRYNVKKWADKPWRGKDGSYHRNYNVEGTANINATLKVINLQTGSVIAVKSITAKDSERTYADGQWPYAPDQTSVVSTATAKVLDQFMKMIAPYTDYVYVKFSKVQSPAGERGVKLATNGLWSTALPEFITEKNDYQNTAAAWHNLGLAYQYNYMFSEAKKAFIQCNKVNPTDECMRGLKNVKLMELDQKKLDQQSKS